MEDEIKNTVQVLLFAKEIAQKQITELEQRRTRPFDSLNLVEKKELLINEALSLFLSNFWSQYEFLVSRIEKEKPEDFHFFVPMLRALMEIYAELLYFINQNDREKLGIFIGNYLRSFSDPHRFVEQSDALKNEYDRYLSFTQEIRDSENIILPQNIEDLSKTKLEKLGFDFPKFDKIFAKPYFTQLSQKSFSPWKKDNAANFYDKYYRVYSTYTHRSFTNQAKAKTGNEVFWVIQFLYTISRLMFELCDNKIFSMKYDSDFVIFSKKIAETYPKLIAFWQTKSPTK